MINITKKITLLLFVCGAVFTSCSSDDDKKDEQVVVEEPVVEDKSTLKVFTNVNFSLDATEGFDSGRYFSTETGKSYKKSQIDNGTLPKVDIAFSGSSSSLNYFMSPNDKEQGIVNGKTTEYINYVKDQFTVSQFTALEKGEDLDKLTIADDGNSFPDSALPLVVLFKNAAGKKGVIYVKSVHRVGSDPRIVADIKIQK